MMSVYWYIETGVVISAKGKDFRRLGFGSGFCCIILIATGHGVSFFKIGHGGSFLI